MCSNLADSFDSLIRVHPRPILLSSPRHPRPIALHPRPIFQVCSTWTNRSFLPPWATDDDRTRPAAVRRALDDRAGRADVLARLQGAVRRRRLVASARRALDRRAPGGAAGRPVHVRLVGPAVARHALAVPACARGGVWSRGGGRDDPARRRRRDDGVRGRVPAPRSRVAGLGGRGGGGGGGVVFGGPAAAPAPRAGGRADL